MKLDNQVVVLTGAASGIGRALARQLADAGSHLALVDRDEAGLQETLVSLSHSGRKHTAHVADLSDREQVKYLPETILQAHGTVHVLINNAGVALPGTFDQTSDEDFDWLMSINFQAVVDLTRSFLPVLLGNDSPGKIVNLSSLFGMVAPAGQTAYCASKFAVRGFSNALAHELEGGNVSVLVVHPGGVATSIVDNAKYPEDADPEEVARDKRAANRFLRMPPAKAAGIIMSAIERDRKRVIVGMDAKVISLIERIMPVSYWSVLALLARRGESGGPGRRQ